METLTATRGETIRFGLEIVPYLPKDLEDIPENYHDIPFDGTETVTCSLKVATNKKTIPNKNNPIIAEATVEFIPRTDTNFAHWLFTIPPEKSIDIRVGTSITDARIELNNGEVIYPDPLLINISEHVTS